MLRLTRTQNTRLQALSVERFVHRLDQMLGERVGDRWTARERHQRVDLLRRSVAEGTRLGIAQEVYLAQFAILHVMTGDRLLQMPQAQRVIEDDTMGWREKVYQLIALAGINLAAGAPPPDAAPAGAPP